MIEYFQDDKDQWHWRIGKSTFGPYPNKAAARVAYLATLKITENEGE